MHLQFYNPGRLLLTIDRQVNNFGASVSHGQV